MVNEANFRSHGHYNNLLWYITRLKFTTDLELRWNLNLYGVRFRKEHSYLYLCLHPLRIFSHIRLCLNTSDQSKSQSSQLNQLVCEWIIHISSRFNSHTKWTSAPWNKLNILLKFLSWFPFWLVMHIIVHCFGCIRSNEIFSFPLIKFQVQVP